MRDYKPVLARMKIQLKHIDPSIEQADWVDPFGRTWSAFHIREQVYWPRYDTGDDGTCRIENPRETLLKLKEAGAAGLVVGSVRKRTRMWLVPIDEALTHFYWLSGNRGQIDYKKVGRTV